MDLLMQAGIIVIAIAFIILMYSIIQTIKVLKSAIEEMRLTIGEVRGDVSRISDDMKETIQHTNEMAVDIKQKLSSLNVVFTAVNDVGQAVQSFTSIAKTSAAQLAAAIERKPASAKSKEADDSDKEQPVSSTIIDGVISGLQLWKKMKRI